MFIIYNHKMQCFIPTLYMDIYLAVLILRYCHNTYINSITTHMKLIIDYIFHCVRLLKLTERNSRIAKSQI